MPTPTLSVYYSVCDDCGETFERPKGRNQVRCYPCKRKRMVDNHSQMLDKSGPHYERLVTSQIKFWRAEAKRLGMRVR